ncbi:restriction endonuclease [Carboxylicivirga taeanensis]|uniref:restriction endonuclease n=1 Tax=Carboxylicivirga taeanensis TaxID=1416875 RepID=UPI003F6DF2A3
MPVPDYQSIMLPLLRCVADEKTYKFRQLIEKLSIELKLSNADRRQLLPSGKQPLFDNRVGWANTYLKKAGLLQSEKRGFVQITNLGMEVLNANPSKIDAAFLRQYDSFNEFVGTNVKNNGESNVKSVESDSQTPKENFEEAYQQINRMLIRQLADQLIKVDPYKFEELVLDLLQAIGYGGNRAEAAQVTKKSTDGGIDGIINEDRLGLDKIYIQAKRYANTVPIKEVRDFAGAMLAHNARKGVFITTSDFPPSAKEFADKIDRTLILIDGKRLAELMIEYNIGISPKETFVYKEIDSDYFES